jgi:hypothetical protein
MSIQRDEARDDVASASRFVTTHWSVVLAAREGDTPEAVTALETLCQTYWYPLYAFVGRKGRSPHDAQDLTQAFFARLLEKNYVAQAVLRDEGNKKLARMKGGAKEIQEQIRQVEDERRGFLARM